MKTPTLIPIDLSKRKDCEHPDIKLNTWYLAKIGGNFYADMFTRQWYGLNFSGVYDAGYQLAYDPEFTHDGWEGLWEIVQKVKKS